MTKQGTTAKVARIPNCDLCKAEGRPNPPLAYADASITWNLRTTWAYVCKMHFDSQGGRLGMGLGQRLIKA